MASHVSLSAYARLLRGNRNVRRLWLAQIVSEIGDWFYQIAIYSLLLEFTGRAQSLAMVIVLQTLPQIFVGPIAGVVNDVISRKRVMIIADLSRMVIVFSMIFVRSLGMVWLIYLLLLSETIMWGFFEPARNAVVPNIAPPEDVVVANALSATTWSINFAVGFGLGGVAAYLLGRDAVFIIDALSFLISALQIQGMRFDEPHAAAARHLRARDLVALSPIAEGVRYIGGNKRLLAMVMLKGGIGFLGVNWVILPVLGQRVFQVKSSGILGMSVLMSARGLGALLGPLASGHWAGSQESRLRIAALIGLFAGATGYLLLGLAPTLALAFAAITFSHAGASVIWVSSTTLLQIHTDDRFRGRVFSADLGFLMLTLSGTCAIAGMAIDRGVPPQACAMSAGFTMLLPAVAWVFALRLWRQPALAGSSP